MRRLFEEQRPFPGQDPWVVRFGDSLLLVQSSANNRRITVKRFSDLRHMDEYTETVVWSPRDRSNHDRQIWAPELHEIGGRWYVYYAASDGRIRNHRMYALGADHPLGPYEELGKVFDPQHDVWAIDLTVLQHDGRLYAIWSSWEDPNMGSFQNLYIAPMANPWTIVGERQLISRPEHGWEMSAGAVNEGPEVLRNTEAGKLFVVYSADASWTNAYKMGVLEWTGHDVADPEAWTKLPRPILTGGGHGSFVETDDGRFVVYHRKMSADPGWADREIRWEPFSWDANGYPVIGRAEVPRPSRRVPTQQRPGAVGFPSAAESAASAPFTPHRVARPNGANGGGAGAAQVAAGGVDQGAVTGDAWHDAAMAEFTVGSDDPDAPDVRALLDQHLAFARRHSPPEDVHALDAPRLQAENVSFFSIREDGRLLAIGALRQLDEHHGELKSMHTAEAARRRGAARAMVDHLIAVARARGYHRVSLETGSMAAFDPARDLYTSVGFTACEPFGDYRVSPNSVCMTLDLATAATS